MMEKLDNAAVLLIIDVQTGLDDPAYGRRNNPGAEQNIGRLLAAWRARKQPIIHVQHLSQRPRSPLYPGKPGVALKDMVKPQGEEQLLQKRVNNAFVGTDLEAQLRAQGHNTLVIVGLTTPHCVSTTARMAGDLGFDTYVVADATAAHELTDHRGQHYSAEQVHNSALAALNGEFAKVVETDNVLQALA
ncbi:MAG: cysteine hydrolase family protein [Candidatus Promineifilaceae bacterium]|nr:cysteine hydrolase family protein [Candidatus Promineifilaceae bacterium]